MKIVYLLLHRFYKRLILCFAKPTTNVSQFLLGALWFDCEELLTLFRKIMSTPSEFLKDLIGNPVVVKLNSGVDYRGILNCLDGYMNIALEQTEEYVNGQLKKKYGDAFIRGNNVLYISRQKRRA